MKNYLRNKYEKSYFFLRKNLIIRSLWHLFKLSTSNNYRKNNSFICFSSEFHYFFSPYLIIILWPILFLIKSSLKKRQIFISINNEVDAIGHIYPEIDWIYRLKHLGILGDNSKIIFCYPKNELLNNLKDILSCNFLEIKLNSFYHFWLYLTAIAFKEISINTSHSTLNHGSINYFFRIGHLPFRDAFEKRQLNYAIIRSNTRNYFPLKKEIKINQFNSSLPEKYVVIQIKTSGINASYTPTDPKTLYKVIKYITKKGYKIIFAGREIMPKEFINLGIQNYSESKDANPLNDYILIRKAQFVICSASGFSYLPDCLGIPTLQINTYGITSIVGEESLIFPSILNIDNKKVSFREQLEEFYKFGQLIPGKNKPNNWQVTDASSDDIFQAFKELEKNSIIKRNIHLSKYQSQFREMFYGQVPGHALCKYSNYFLENNKDRMDV